MWFPHQATLSSLAELVSSSLPRLAPEGASFCSHMAEAGHGSLGVHGGKCQGACSTSWVTSSEGLYSGKADPRDHACSYPGFPHCECVRDSCFRNTILALPLNSDELEYWSLWLPVPRMPKSRAYWSEGTRWRWDCVVLFSEKL